MPLALHVDYWDYIGGKDPYARRKLSQLQRLALVYTPQVLLQGRDFRGWRTEAFDEALARINAQPARAGIRLASAELLERAEDAALYLAVYESKLQSRQTYVVLEWQGPFGITGRVTKRRRLALLPGANP